MNRFQHLIKNAGPSVSGLARLAVSAPVFAAKLLVLRSLFFLTRRSLFHLRDPHGFPINSHYALISYWDFFVERALQDDAWIGGFCSQPHPVAIDVGANAGTFSYLLTRLNPGAEIYAFEPLPDLERNLREVEAISSNAFHIYSAACGRERGKAVLFADDSGDTGAHLNEVKRGEGRRSFNVEVLPLDEIIKAEDIYLLKIDAEGYDAFVLEGARRTLSRTHYLIIEAGTPVEFDQIQTILGEKWHATRLSSVDFLFSQKL
jgi:FkbM family methyltransferase